MCFLHVEVLVVQLKTTNSQSFFHVILSNGITDIRICTYMYIYVHICTFHPLIEIRRTRRPNLPVNYSHEICPVNSAYNVINIHNVTL
jgi:hypothetical protein